MCFLGPCLGVLSSHSSAAPSKIQVSVRDCNLAVIAKLTAQRNLVLQKATAFLVGFNGPGLWYRLTSAYVDQLPARQDHV